MKHYAAALLFLILSIPLRADPPAWVLTYGVETPYGNDAYLTGFAMTGNEEPDSSLRSRELALADLTGKIETKVYSMITLEESDGPQGFVSSSSIVTRCVVDTTVRGVRYIHYREGNSTYALAYISLDQLLKSYGDKAADLYLRIKSDNESAHRHMAENRSGEALKYIYSALKSAVEFYEQHSLYRSVGEGGDSGFFQAVEGLSGLEEFMALERELNRKLYLLESPESLNFTDAMRKAALILSRQDMRAGNLVVPPFTYELSSFSSPFGRYGASVLEGELVAALPYSAERTIYRSNYRVREDQVELSIMALDTEGRKLARADVRFPLSGEISRYELTPRNFEESMTAMREFASGALTEGGIDIDIWTDKGRDRDSPVYERGETLRLYMRVNQPSFLQITYHLATGDKVLLERSYYIGMDKVNRAVKLPWDFEVQPPFGAEQLIVTAFSQEPPEPLATIGVVGGEVYEIFPSMDAVTARTRGLARKGDRESRVGEAILNLTTVDRRD